MKITYDYLVLDSWDDLYEALKGILFTTMYVLDSQFIRKSSITEDKKWLCPIIILGATNRKSKFDSYHQLHNELLKKCIWFWYAKYITTDVQNPLESNIEFVFKYSNIASHHYLRTQNKNRIIFFDTMMKELRGLYPQYHLFICDKEIDVREFKKHIITSDIDIYYFGQSKTKQNVNIIYLMTDVKAVCCYNKKSIHISKQHLDDCNCKYLFGFIDINLKDHNIDYRTIFEDVRIAPLASIKTDEYMKKKLLSFARSVEVNDNSFFI